MERQSLLVTPSFHDAARLEVFGPQLADSLAEANMDVLWVMADDGSGEKEIARLHRLQEDLQSVYPKIEVFSPGDHFGKGGVIHRVWRAYREVEWFSFLDADGSVDGETYVKLLKRAHEEGQGNAVIGSRRDSPETQVEQSLIRKVSHKVMGKLIQTALQLPVVDTQCGAKCVHGEDYRKVESRLKEYGLLFDAELLLALDDIGVSLVEIPVDWEEMPGGPVSPFRDAIPMLWSLIRLRLRTKKGRL